MSTKRTSRPKTISGRSCARQAGTRTSAGAWVGSKPIPAAPERATAATSASTWAGDMPPRPIPVVSRNSPPRSTSLTAGVSKTCTHSTRFPSLWPPAATVTSPDRNSSSPSRSATVKTDCPESGRFMDTV